jgi:branched-chain amino acid transport system ATP-binding protein
MSMTPTLQTAALHTGGLHKAWGSLVVVDNVFFNLAPGARHALIGPNGAGKTTFINLVTGELKPDQGEVSLYGEQITNLLANERVKRGMVRTFQINQLFMGLSALDNVAMSIAEREGTAWQMFKPSGTYRKHYAEAHALLVEMQLGAAASRSVRELAYGQQRLLEMAIALALKPRVLLLDEPAAGVPTGESALLMEVLERLPADVAVLLIEHDMDLVFRFADRITVLERGHVVCEGNPDDVARDDHVRAIYFGEGSRTHA